MRLFSLVPLVWESNPKLQGGWCKTQLLRAGRRPAQRRARRGGGRGCCASGAEAAGVAVRESQALRCEYVVDRFYSFTTSCVYWIQCCTLVCGGRQQAVRSRLFFHESLVALVLCRLHTHTSTSTSTCARAPTHRRVRIIRTHIPHKRTHNTRRPA